jgi:hypothetical protein
MLYPWDTGRGITVHTFLSRKNELSNLIFLKFYHRRKVNSLGCLIVNGYKVNEERRGTNECWN